MTDLRRDEFRTRREGLEALIAALFEDETALLGSVAADDWSEAMVEAGFRRHAETWAPGALVDALDRELESVGGVDALEDESPGSQALRRPETIAHVWPRLPGAGLTPVLFGALLGAEQILRPSSRAGGFASYLSDTWEPIDQLPPLAVDEGDTWRVADVVVASGTDATIGEIRRQLQETRGARGWRLNGYGHRVSLAVVDDGSSRKHASDDDTVDLETIADELAADAVLWHQSGCFSLQGVLFAGDRTRLEAFARALGDAIERWEERLDARLDEIGQLARRAQARNVAEIEHEVFGEGDGWAEIRDGAFSGATPAPHVVSCHGLEGPESLEKTLAIAPHHLQGIALALTDSESARRGSWIRHLTDCGATRICSPGQLQRPPAAWWHDGRPNVLEWLSVCRVDREDDRGVEQN